MHDLAFCSSIQICYLLLNILSIVKNTALLTTLDFCATCIAISIVAVLYTDA